MCIQHKSITVKAFNICFKHENWRNINAEWRNYKTLFQHLYFKLIVELGILAIFEMVYDDTKIARNK